MTVGSRRMFVGELAMFVSRSCVLLRRFVLAEIVKTSRLEMMMRSGLVVSRLQKGDAHSPDASVTVPFIRLLHESE
jgi:hypothetical protein